MARYGTLNVFENLATPEQAAEMRRRFGERFNEICEGITENVGRCCAVVRVVDPIQLLQRCYWHWYMLSLEAPAEESKQDGERNDAFELLEYTQKLVCGLGPCTAAPPATEEQFTELAAATRDVFRPLKVEYFLSRTARLSERADYDVDLDDYAVRNEMIWLGVRGLRYLSHEAEYFRKILRRQSDLLESVYGVSADAIANGVDGILSSLSKGVGAVMHEFDAFRTETMDAIEQDASLASMAPPDAMDAVVRKNGWESRRDSILGRFLGTDLFEVEKLTGWPTEFIDDLSLRPGKDVGFADGSAESAWPTKFSEMQFAPFVRYGDKSYCFHVHGLADRLYRAIERAVRRRQPSSSERWNRGQKRASEDLAAELFSRMLPSADIHVDGHYWATDRITGEAKWTDCDVIVVYERQLFVIEVKAGRYTHKPPGRNIRDHLKSLKELIESAAAQASRFLDELENQSELVLYNARREELVKLHPNDFDRTIRCCVSLEQIDDIAPRAEDLEKLGIDIGPHPVWTLSLNDLLVCADVFTNPLIFMDYVAERLRAFASPTCHVSDELDHLGLYLEHNRYVMRADKFNGAAAMEWIGYRDVFDRYYSDLWQGEQATLPKQEMPKWLAQALHLLAQSRKPGRVRVAESLLSMSGETRQGIAELVARVQTLQQRQNRPRPISCGGDVRLTVVVNVTCSYQMEFSDARDHAISVMTLQDEKDRLMVWLQYSEHEVLEDIRWAKLSMADAAAMNPEILSERVERLRSSRKKLGADDTFRPVAEDRKK